MNFTEGGNPYKKMRIGIHKTPSHGRMTGKTTRTINDAIEALYTHGSIRIPSMIDLNNDNRGIAPEYNAIDPDWTIHHRIQKNLLERIIHRLNREHQGKFFYDIKTRKMTITQ